MYVYYIYPAMSTNKQTKELPNCPKQQKQGSYLMAWTASSDMSELKLLPFIIVAQHESGTRRIISFITEIYRVK